MHNLNHAGPDGNAGDSADVSGGSSADAEVSAARFGGGGWSSPRRSGGFTALDRRNQ
ncbi:hypothetical protein ACFWU5_16665 [Nocardia sp. NPDC058640]|uniref:hypothetical protein n=1 Tax=Nocardia sp. NPDC058640 TaxID=3346571 RepID=UPI00365339B4